MRHNFCITKNNADALVQQLQQSGVCATALPLLTVHTYYSPLLEGCPVGAGCFFIADSGTPRQATPATPLKEGNLTALQETSRVLPVFDAIIITSAYAAIDCMWPQVPTYCVGQATAQAAHTAGYSVVYSGTAGVHVLCQHIDVTHQRILYLRGVQVSTCVTSLLPQRYVEQRVVYAMRSIPHAPELPPHAVPVFWSTQAVYTWQKLKLPQQHAALCVSPRVAAAWGGSYYLFTQSNTLNDIVQVAATYNTYAPQVVCNVTK